MTDYASFKVPELKKLLTDRKLATTGNKADLVARLQENDQAAAAAPAAESKPGAPNSTAMPRNDVLTNQTEAKDEIDFEDDDAAKPAASAPAATAPADAAATTTAPATATDAEAPKAEAEAPKEPAAPLFTLGLSSTAADDEARRRAERAKRFGIEEDDEAKKLAERASRFGIDEKDLAKGLDSALPERSLKRGRGRGPEDGNRPGKRQSHDRRGDGRRGDGRKGGDRNQNNRNQGGAPKVASIMNDPAEKAKAAARAARFATA